MDDFTSLQLTSIGKRFGANVALQAVDFDLTAGEVHALVGENGAGKSTLMRILAGIYTEFDGSYKRDGQDFRPASPNDALALGIGMIHQELSVIPELSVAENLMLERLPVNRLGFIDWKELYRSAQNRLQAVQFGHIDVRSPLGVYPLGFQQIVEILRVVDSGAQVLIMDEPTSALSPNEIDKLMEIINGLRREGRGIVYISHFISEVQRISDRVTVLRDGKCITTVNTNQTNETELISLILGHTNTVNIGAASADTGSVLLELTGLNGTHFSDIDLQVSAGEVVGIFGAIGAGHFELAKAIFGLYRIHSGQVTIDNIALPRNYNSSRAIVHGFAYATESRRQSLFLEDAVYKNITLPHLKQICGLILSHPQEFAAAAEVTRRTNLQPADPSLNAGQFSGGNQQKVAISRWLTVPPRVLIVSEPTRGMDVGAKADVFNILRELSDQGIAIIIVSSEPETAQAISNRIITMARGRITGEVKPKNFSQNNLLRLVST